MTTYTWIGNYGSNDPNDASQTINWSPSGIPGDGDTASIGSNATFDVISPTTSAITNVTFLAAGNDVLNFTNVNLVNSSMTLGSATTLDISQVGSTIAGFDVNVGDNSQSAIHQSGVNASLTINAAGTINSDAFLVLDSPGGTIAVKVGTPGNNPGDYYSRGPILDLGGKLTIATGTGNMANGTRFSNAGYILVASALAAASAKFSARMDGTSGVIEVMGGTGTAAAIEIATNMGGGQVVEFGGNSATVTIDATTTLGAYGNVGGTPTTVLQNSFERFNLFGPGDTIDLAGISAVGLTYSFGNDPNWGNNVLSLAQGGTVIARLRMSASGGYITGTGTYGANNTSVFNSNFILGTDGAGGTDITVSSSPVYMFNGGTSYPVGGALAVFNGATSAGTLDWGTAVNWSGTNGALPGAYEAVGIINSIAQLSAFQNYVITVTSNEVAGGLSLDDHFADLQISAGLTLQAFPGQSGGGLVETAGDIDVTTGGSLTTTNIYQSRGGGLTIEAGGVVTVSGVMPFTQGYGLQGLDIEQELAIAAGTLNSQGAIVLGLNASASADVQSTGSVGASVTATFTDVGANIANDPSQTGGGTASSLTIFGTNTVWRDIGGDASTNYSGAMLVGGGGATANALGTVSLGNGGVGSLTVDQGAVLIDRGYAVLGVQQGAYGAATVQNGAQWQIGVVGLAGPTQPGSIVVGATTVFGTTPALLSVGLGGSGNLTVANGGTITLGSEAAGATEFNVVIGGGLNTLAATVVGMATVNGGLLDSSLGAISVGQQGNGSLTINNAGTVLAGAGGGIPFGVIVGGRNYVLNAVTTAAQGTLSIGGGSGTSLLSSTADFVDGRDGIGNVMISTGGSLQVTGALWEGGYGSAGASTDTGSTFMLNGGTASFSGGATLYAGSTLDLQSGALQFGAGAAGLGNIAIAAGTIVTAAGGNGGRVMFTDNAGGGTLVNAGILQAVTAGATLEVQANVGGNGTEQVGNGGFIKFDRLVGAGNTISLGGTATTGTVEFGAGVSMMGTLTNFYGSGNQIMLDNIGTVAPSLNWTQVNASYGTLGVSINGTVTNTVTITGSHPGGFGYVAVPSINGLMISALDSAPSAQLVSLSETGPGLSLGVLTNGTNILQGTLGTIALATTAGAVVTLYDSGNVVGTGTADGSGNVSISAAALGVGTHVLTAVAAGSGTISAATTLIVAGAAQTQFVLGAGNDRLVGGANGSVVFVNTTGTVNINLGDGNDDIFAAGSTATVALGNGTNEVLGGNGNDVVTTGGGNNSIYLGSGNDSITAGGGINHFILGNGTNTVSAGNGQNEMELGGGANSVTVGNGNNYIQAGNGNDVVNAGTGNSGIQLGNGNNSVSVTGGSDIIILGDGTNTVSLGASMSFLRVGNGNNTVSATSGNEQIDIYGSGNNSLILGSGNNLIYGGGNDAISLGSGNNTVSMTDGSDSIIGGNGANAVTLYSTVSSSTVVLGNGNNTVIVGGGGASITLGSGNNYVEALGGNNTITVGGGSNVVKGDSGNDVFNVVAGYVHGNGPTDVFNLGSGGGAAYGGWGANSINISSGAWYVAAAAGSDRIEMTGVGGFAYVQMFDVSKDMLVLSNAAFGLGVSGLTGNATQAVGALLSSNTDGSFSGNSLLAYNTATGVLYDRANTSSGGVAVATFVNDPTSVAGRLFVGA